MGSIALGALVYSCQVLVIVCAAAMAEPLLHGSAARARLAYWRVVVVLCLCLPLIGSSAREVRAVSVAFDVLPVGSVIATDTTVSRALPVIAGALPLTWAAGASLGIVWLLAGGWRIRQLRRRSTPAAIASHIAELRAVLAPHTEFRWSDEVQQPVTIGVRRAVVLLPRRFDDLSDEGQRAVACHELLHVRRRDWLWTVAEALTRAVFWFHPGVWWIVDRLQLLREQVVDELVVGRTSARRDYMMALLTFADCARPSVLSSAFLRRHHLKSRMRELVKERHMSFPRLTATIVLLTLVMGGVAAVTVRALPLNVSAMAQTGAASRLEFRLAESTPGPGLRSAVVAGSDQPIYLHSVALATWADVATAKIVQTGNSTSTVAVTLNGDAAARMASATASHLGRPMAIILEGRVVAAPIVRAPISDSAMITGITAAAAQELIEANVACHVNPAQCVAAVLPVPVYREKPEYTQAAMDALVEGRVLLEAVVLPDGSTGDVTVVRSLDEATGLDQEAIKALKRWTWKPGTRDGAPARVAVQVEMTFTLK